MMITGDDFKENELGEKDKYLDHITPGVHIIDPQRSRIVIGTWEKTGEGEKRSIKKKHLSGSPLENHYNTNLCSRLSLSACVCVCILRFCVSLASQSQVMISSSCR